jgi:hypothetical protein
MYWARGNSTVIESLYIPTCSPRPIAELETEQGTFADFLADAERLYAFANDGQVIVLPR